MVELRRHGSEVASVFDLLGTDENDLTSALGFTMARCPQLCEAIAARIGVGGGDAVIAMEVRHAEGRTDLELRVGQDLFRLRGEGRLAASRRGTAGAVHLEYPG